MKVNLGPAKGKDSATTLGPVAGHRRRARALPGRRRLPGPRPAGVGQRRRGRPGPAVQHGLAVRGAHRLRLPRHRGPRRRRARLGHLRQRRLPGRAVGPPRRARPAAAAARRRRRDDRRGHRHHPQPRRPRARTCRRSAPARPRPRNRTRMARGSTARSSSSPAPGRGRAPPRRGCSPPRARRSIGRDLTPEPAEELPGVEYRQLDVTDAAGWAALAGDLATARRRPRPGRQRRHHLAGAAGRARPGRPGAGHEVNVTGTLLGIQALTPLMTDGGSVVVVGSVAALTGHYPVAYTARSGRCAAWPRPPASSSARAASGSTPSTPATSRRR